MIDEIALEAAVKALKKFEQDDGFDRQGSHAAGELVHYTWRLRDYIEDWRMKYVAKAVIQAYLANTRKEVSEWLPIESCPYGEFVLLSRNKGQQGVTQCTRIDDDLFVTIGVQRYVDPDVWQPLPKPPSEEV